MAQVNLEGNKFVGDQQSKAYEGRGIAEIERQLKQKFFTRDESKRLIALLRSRTTDLPNIDGCASKFTEEAAETKDAITSQNENHAYQPDQRTILFEHDTLQPTAPGGVGSSPVDLAKAYMQALTSTSGLGNQNGRTRIKRTLSDDNDSAPRLSFSSAVKALTCWPGAVVQSDLAYNTPQRSSIVFSKFQQAPYSSGVFSRSSSKFQVDGGSPRLTSAGWKQQCTAISGGEMTMKRDFTVLEDELALTDDMRSAECIRPKRKPSSQLADLDERMPRVIIGTSTVHRQSSEVAKKILEHLDRNLPSPKEKALELKRMITRRKSSSDSAPIITDATDNWSLATNSGNGYATCLFGAQECTNTRKVGGGHSLTQSNGKGRLSDFPPKTGSDVLLIPKFLTQSPGHESIWKSTSNCKFAEEHKASDHSSKPSEVKNPQISDYGSGFSFPVPMDSVASSEPPTPTMISSLPLESRICGTTGGIPSFTFGSSGAGSGPVFVFDTSLNAKLIGSTAPKFHFGSGDKRLCFRSVGGKDTVCCQLTPG